MNNFGVVARRHIHPASSIYHPLSNIVGADIIRPFILLLFWRADNICPYEPDVRFQILKEKVNNVLSSDV